MAELPDKAHWQQDFKRRYGVPDGLARGVKMGDRFEWWRQTETRLGPAKDWMGLFTQIDTLIRDMQIYAQALKMADPNKFKAENGFGKVKNYEQAIREFNLLLVEATRKKHIYETLAKPLLGVAESEAVRQVLESGWLTQGSQVAALEREFAAFVGATHACAVSNCTSALHLALKAVGVGRGDEVVTVSHSFIAAANAIRSCGAEPSFVDIEPDGFNLNPDKLDAAVTSRTRAILCVHQLGMPCDLEAVLARGRAHALPVIEDAACAVGSEIRIGASWEKIGRPHGDVVCFSFHPRKVITTGEGGMLTTANPEWDRRFRLWRQHGMDAPDTVRHDSQTVIFESYPVEGFNYRMTDLQAAIGRCQLRRLPDIIERRRALAERLGRGVGRGGLAGPGVGLRAPVYLERLSGSCPRGRARLHRPFTGGTRPLSSPMTEEVARVVWFVPRVRGEPLEEISETCPMALPHSSRTAAPLEPGRTVHVRPRATRTFDGDGVETVPAGDSPWWDRRVTMEVHHG